MITIKHFYTKFSSEFQIQGVFVSQHHLSHYIASTS